MKVVLYTWGWSEYGKLGTGTDGSYNTRDSSIKITYTATDISKIPMEGKIIQVSAGKHHAACLTDEGLGYTWGDNGYGKLGHRDQKQRNAPTRVQGARFSTLLCGDVSTAGLGWPEYQGRPFSKQSGDGLVWVWGVLKGSNGEGATHPVPNYDVQGWAIDKSNFALGGTHCALSGEGAGVAWAFSPVAFGQLGFGPNGVKSSHTANKMDVGEGLVARQVVASVGQTHLLVDSETAKGVEHGGAAHGTVPRRRRSARAAAQEEGPLVADQAQALRLRLVTSQGSPYPSRSPRARPSGWTRTQGLSHADSHAPLLSGRPPSRGTGRWLLFYDEPRGAAAQEEGPARQ